MPPGATTPEPIDVFSHPDPAEPRRRVRRYPTYLDAAILDGTTEQRATVLSLSMGGMFLAAEPRPLVGTALRVRFHTPDDETVTLPAMVIYGAVMQDRPGVGLMFPEPAMAERGVESVRLWCEEYGTPI